MLDAITGLGATKTGLDLIKIVRELLKRDKLDKTEIFNQLDNLHEALLKAKEALGDAQDLNRELTHKLEDNKRLSDIEADMEYVNDGGYYIRKSEKAAGKIIFYCPICWKVDKKDIPLNPMYNEGLYRCDIHNRNYETSAYRTRSGNSNPTNYDEL